MDRNHCGIKFQSDAWIELHDETNEGLAMLMVKMRPPMPVAMGVIYRVSRPTYETQAHAQVAEAKAKDGAGELSRIFSEGNTWVVD